MKLKKLTGGIVTDSTALGEPLDPESCNVFRLLSLFEDAEQLDQIAGWYKAGRRDGEPFGYGHAKQRLAAGIEARFGDARAKRDAYREKPDEVEALLQSARQSAEKARTMPVKSQRAPRLMWEALQDLREATGLDPERADAWFFLGQVEEQLYSWPGQERRTEGFREGALEHLQKACTLAGSQPDRKKHCQARDKLQRLVSP